jgi:hypothetical protein
MMTVRSGCVLNRLSFGCSLLTKIYSMCPGSSRLSSSGTTGGLVNLDRVELHNNPLSKLCNETAMWGGN